MNNVEWKFQQQTFPKMKEKGIAHVKVGKARVRNDIILMLQCLFSFSLAFEEPPKLVISKTEFTLGEFELKLNGASAR